MKHAMQPVVDRSAEPGYARPRDPVELWLARRWEQVLGFGVGITENFFEIGGNSLDAARVVNFVLDEFDIQLPLNVLTDNPTVASLAARLREQHARPPSAPLVEIQGGDGTCPPLFLVHPANGQVGLYCHLARALGDEFTLFGLQADGLYSDAAPLGTVAAMASAYVEAIRTVQPAGPYLLGGCSTGAAIAYEMACRLVDADIRLLAAIDTELVEPGADLVPRDAPPDFVARSLRVWQANVDAVRDWQPRPYPGPLDIFRADHLPSTVDWPATVVRRVHECGTGIRQLATGLRELIGS